LDIFSKRVIYIFLLLCSIKMKLLKKEAQNICNQYGLGKVKEIKLIEGGLINDNFEIKTDQGQFIIRFLGHKFSEANKIKLKFEFSVLEFLNKNKFPYKVPSPLKNRKRIYLSRLNRKNYWIYKKIKGNKVKILNREKFKEIPILLATYHKFVKKIKLEKVKKIYQNEFFNLNWLKTKYSEMKRVKPKTKLDKLMSENLEFFSNILGEINKIKFNKNIIATHSDFHKGNMLFKDNKLIALLDFDNLETIPLIKDVASAIQNTCFKDNKLNKNTMRLFLREYEKINKLTKEEKDMIVPAIIREKCIFFWWDYKEMKKRKDLKYKFMVDTIRATKDLVK